MNFYGFPNSACNTIVDGGDKLSVVPHDAMLVLLCVLHIIFNPHLLFFFQAMASPEDHAYGIMRELDVDYVLVIFGGLIGYSSDGE